MGRVPTPALYRYAANRDYRQIPSRVASNPVDIFWTDRYGSTALHLLCQDRSAGQDAAVALLAAVNAIVEVAPEVVAWPNVATWTPLHFAAEQRLGTTTELILCLLAACPSAVSVRTKSGYKSKTPFHIACEANAPYRVLKAMLSRDWRLAVQPFCDATSYASWPCSENNHNPLQLLWRHEPRTNETMRKMALLLQAAYCEGLDSSTIPFCLANAVCTNRCPTTYARLVLAEAAVDQPNARGRYPLHYAVVVPRHNMPTLPTSYTQLVISQLVQQAPDIAAVPDPAQGGRLPLHVAVGEAGLTWHKSGLRELAWTHPPALLKPDPATGLVPAWQSATRATLSKLHLSTTYELLRMEPSVILKKKPTAAGEDKVKSDGDADSTENSCESLPEWLA
jgi:ankyrin repeat protein